MANKNFNFTINGKARNVQTEPTRSLLEVLREDLLLTGTKYGCGEGACGACTVLLDGQRVFSCSTPIQDADGKTITTIEGLASGDKLHPVQEAFIAEGAFQCGYCTPGMIMATVGLLQQHQNPTDAQVAEVINGHLCRCCSYPKLLNAVHRAVQNSGTASSK
jgi:carbon-monoxide dehydrogenase small subunit